jgi:hypothetical protein
LQGVWADEVGCGGYDGVGSGGDGGGRGGGGSGGHDTFYRYVLLEVEVERLRRFPGCELRIFAASRSSRSSSLRGNRSKVIYLLATGTVKPKRAKQLLSDGEHRAGIKSEYLTHL